MARVDRWGIAAESVASAGRNATDHGDFDEGGDEILTSIEACRFLKIGRTKLWELTRKHSLPAYRVGNGKTSGLRYKRSELLWWLERNRVGDDSRV